MCIFHESGIKTEGGGRFIVSWNIAKIDIPDYIIHEKKISVKDLIYLQDKIKYLSDKISTRKKVPSTENKIKINPRKKLLKFHYQHTKINLGFFFKFKRSLIEFTI